MEILVRGERNETYVLSHTAAGWACDCPDYVQRANGGIYTCKHAAHVAVVARDLFMQSMSGVVSRRAREILATV